MQDTRRLNSKDYLDALGWILAILVPLIFFHELHQHHVPWNINYFTTFLSATLILWMFRVIPYLVPALLILACCLLLNIVPENIVLSGFYSKSFFLVLSFSFLGAIILKSNLLMRPTLWLLSKIPPNLILLEFFLYLIGLFSSAIINVQTNRFDISVPFYKIFLQETKLIANPVARRCLSLASYAGTIYFSELFLTGKSTNLPMLEMLPIQTQTSFSWLFWLIAASVPVLIMQIPLLVTFFLFIHKRIDFTLDIQELLNKRQALGKFTFAEMVAVGSIVVLIIGIVLSSFHLVELAWFCFTLLFFILLFPILSKQEFRSTINWAFLLYLAASIGIVQSMHYLHLDTTIINLFPKVFVWASKNIYTCTITIFIASMICTAFIGTVPSVIILIPIFLPLASELTISPWIVGFIISVACESWFLSYQSTYQLYFDELTENDELFDKKKIVQMNILFILFRFAALMLSIPYWHYLGLL